MSALALSTDVPVDVDVDANANATIDTSSQSDNAVTAAPQSTDASAFAPTTDSPAPESTPSIESEAIMSEHTYQYTVKMTCGGCSSAIERALGKAQREGAGIDSFTVSLDTQSVDVKGSILQADLTARIAKTGKKAEEEVTEPLASVVPPSSGPY
ncbi:hypothetical protein EW145_g5347 [Phellinidium pouzarii]|uniref:HMA domain-containing protein n=1 Tax=Phellinidium pouzarii TaxID=167371 RepID=A0A4S4L096_9AGAM|nr:hypothetical protein EW145_g5347 [Phellinidium pouzarii]